MIWLRKNFECIYIKPLGFLFCTAFPMNIASGSRIRDQLGMTRLSARRCNPHHKEPGRSKSGPGNPSAWLVLPLDLDLRDAWNKKCRERLSIWSEPPGSRWCNGRQWRDGLGSSDLQDHSIPAETNDKLQKNFIFGGNAEA